MSAIILFIYVFFVLSLLSFSFQGFYRSTSRIHTVPSLRYNPKDIEQLCESANPKSALLELCQNVFQGKYPVYTWNNEVLEISVPSVFTTSYTINVPPEEVLTNAKKKEEENKASAELLRALYHSAVYRPLVSSYLSQRMNKENVPVRFTREDMLNLLSFKTLAILIDIENVGDYKKFFYVTKEGDIRCLCPPLPPFYVAPSIVDSSYDDSSRESPSGYTHLYSDEEILVLAYAHAAGPQSAWANRVTYSEHKDAADALILFDLGAIQLLKNLRKIILVTKDKFSLNAQACFFNDERRFQRSFSPVEPSMTDLQFVTEESCREVTLSLGRIAL